jgi:predicted DNA-binding protein YlxM (UPF0122 family)
MSMPEEVLTKNKIRDAKIITMYARDAVSMEEIGVRFGISGTRVQQIIYRNRHLLQYDKEYERAKRVHNLKRWIKAKPESSKDPVDIQGELRKEIEGEGTAVKSETKVIIIRETVNANQDQGGTVSRSVLVQRS